MRKPGLIKTKSGVMAGLAALPVLVCLVFFFPLNLRAATPVLTSINTAPENASMFIGNIQHTSAVAFDQNGAVFPGAVITWSSSNTAVATVAVDPSPARGTNATITGMGVGTANITATATDPATGISVSGTNTGQGTIPVSVVSLNPPVLTKVNVTPANPIMLPGDTYQFTVATLDQNGAHYPATVTWSSSDPNVVTIDPNTAWYTAVGTGTATITATATAIGASGTIVTGTTLVTVHAAPPVLTTIKVSPANPSLNVGTTRQFTAETLDQYGSHISAALTWSSSNKSVGVIDSSGLLAGAGAGTTTITATSGAVSGNTAATIVSVALPPIAPPTDTSILGIGVSNITKNSATINWETSSDSVGFVKFGINKKKLPAKILADQPSQNQTVTLTGLKKNVKYYFQITATLPDGSHQTQSAVLAFRTKKK